jgi:hypothetical protein
MTIIKSSTTTFCTTMKAYPHDEIVRLEVHIEQLAAKTESCPKFILVSRIGVWGGGIVLGAILLGVIRFDLGIMRPAFRNVTCKEFTR